MEESQRLEVRNWVQNAIAFFEQAGKEIALDEIDDPRGRFAQNERYIYALDLRGKCLAHPANKTLSGRSLIELRDSAGKSFVQKIVRVAKARGYGFTEYQWPAPGKEGDLHKTVFFEKVDGMILCCGFYSPEDEASYQKIFDRLFGPLE